MFGEFMCYVYKLSILHWPLYLATSHLYAIFTWLCDISSDNRCWHFIILITWSKSPESGFIVDTTTRGCVIVLCVVLQCISFIWPPSDPNETFLSIEKYYEKEKFSGTIPISSTKQVGMGWKSTWHHFLSELAILVYGLRVSLYLCALGRKNQIFRPPFRF